MKNIRWLTVLASKNPLVFSLALLMIATSTLSIVVANRDNRIKDCDENRKFLIDYYNRRLDSMDTYYKVREIQLNSEVTDILNNVVSNYKEELDKQRDLNMRIQTEILKNKNLIDKAKSKINKLQ